MVKAFRTKRLWLVIVAILVAVACAFAFVACGGDDKGGNGGGTNVKVGGTYYLYENGETFDEFYITFKNGKWTDDEGVSGNYTLSNSDITLYTELGGEKDEYASGTVSGNDISLSIMGADVVYRKGDDIDGNTKEKTLEYALSGDKSYYIVKGIGGLTGDITVPDEYKRKPVKEIAENAFANATELVSVTISDNVTTVGKRAFYNCANLTEIVLGDGVTAVDESTFENCGKLESVTVGAAVSCFGDKAFYACFNLESIYYNGSVSDWASIDFVSNPLSDGNIYIVGNNTAYVKHKSRDLYIDNDLLVTANITDVETISDSAFYGYAQLESVTIGGDVSEIGDSAFYGCASLETLTITGGVKTIGKSSFRGCNNLNSVSLAESVKTIGEYAFDSCENLATVNMGDGVTYIAKGAFMACENLSSLTIGSSVSEICEQSFYECHSLTSVTIPSSTIFIGKDAFFATGLTSATFRNVDGWKVQVGNKFQDVENLDDVQNAAALLKNSILMQGYSDYDWEKPTLQYTLSNDGTYYIVSNNGTACRSEIVIPETYNEKPVKELANDAFYYCRGLTSIEIPSSVTSIGLYAFLDCDNLTKITYTGSLADWCKMQGLDNLYLSGKSLYINGVDVKGELVIPDGVTSISDYAFRGCNGITSVTIPNSVTSIGEEAFNFLIDDDSVITILYTGNVVDWCKIKGLVNLMDASGLLYINGVEVKGELIIPNGVMSIPDYAFAGCKSLTSVTIPDSVTSIGWRTFSGCSCLTRITIGCSITSINSEAFLGCSVASITYTGNLKDWCEIDGLSSLMSYYTSNRILYIKGNEITGTLVIPNGVTSIKNSAFCGLSGITSVNIQNGVTSIGNDVFYGCSSLTSVTIPDSVTSIGGEAFRNCSSLTSIMIPDSVTSIGADAFADCNSLTSVTIGNSVTSIGAGAFSRCNSLTSINVDSSNPSFSSQGGILYNKAKTEIINVPLAIAGHVTIPNTVTHIGRDTFCNCTGLTSITIPEGVMFIDWEAFRNCSDLTSVTIPSSVTSILFQAFCGCSSLTSITFNGTMEQWNAISKADNWDTSTGDYTVVCTDGTLSKSES